MDGERLRSFRLITELDRIRRGEEVVLFTTQGSSRVAWWVDRAGREDRLRERRTGRRHTQTRSVRAPLTPSESARGYRYPETVMAVGLDGTLGWVSRDDEERELRRSRPSRRTVTAASWKATSGLFDRIERWGSRALVLAGDGGDRVIALDDGAARCSPRAERLVEGGGYRIGLSPEVVGEPSDPSFFARRLALCSSGGRLLRALPGATDESGGVGSSAYGRLAEPTRLVRLGDVLAVERRVDESESGNHSGVWETDLYDVRRRVDVATVGGWIQRSGEAPPGPAFGDGVAGTDASDDDRLLLGDRVVMWRTARYVSPSETVDELRVVDHAGPRLLRSVSRPTDGGSGPRALRGLRLEGATARWVEPDGEHSATLDPVSGSMDSGRELPLVSAPRE